MRSLGLASHEGQASGVSGVVEAAFDAGFNYFFYYDVAGREYRRALDAVLDDRDGVVIATGTESRQVKSAKPGDIDVFFLEYVHPGEDMDAVQRALDEIAAWKESGRIRYVGATAHDRALARQLVEDERVDVVMHRFNMAHRKAVDLVFPYARERDKPVVAFTATRWSSLLRGHPDWKHDPPTAADCYRYCLSYPEVHIALTAPLTAAEAIENAAVLDAEPMSDEERAHWDAYGDLIYGTGTDDFETQWP